MSNHFFIPLFVLCLLSFNVLAKNDNNPFAKNASLNIGKDIAWNIDKDAVLATKSESDNKGNYYHLVFDNKRLKLIVSHDANGSTPKQFSQLEVKDVKIDGKRSTLFTWCLNNQQRHNRFLQQGLVVKKDVCSIDGSVGSFVMNLDSATLLSLQKAKRLSIRLSPFRTPLDLNYDISDFNDMMLALNAGVAPALDGAASASSVKHISKKCWAGPPAKYDSIKSVEYDCDDHTGRQDAEGWVVRLVQQEKAKEQKLAASRAVENDLQRKLAEEKKREMLVLERKQKEKSQLEAAAITASEMKQAKISDEITQKMLKVCSKHWRKGEHRCHCQKYIEHAPASIQSSSTCE